MGSGGRGDVTVTDKVHRILVVDDDAPLVESVCSVLAADRYEVTSCHSAGEALQKVVSWSPHVVLLEHFLPEGLGKELCARLRSLGIATPVILCSVRADMWDRIEGLDAGADDYVSKPFATEELRARIRAQLRRAVPQSVSPSLVAALVEGLRAPDPDQRSLAVETVRRTGGGLHFRLFGGLRVEWRGVDVSTALWNRRIPRFLLKLLLLGYGRKQPSDVLIDRLWPHAEIEFGRRNLKVNIQRLRAGFEVFGLDRVERVEDGYRLNLATVDEFDLRDFDRAAETVRAALAHPHRVPTLPDSLNRLLGYDTGALLADELYADWAVEARRSARATLVDLGTRANAALRRGSCDGPRL